MMQSHNYPNDVEYSYIKKSKVYIGLSPYLN